MNTTSSNLSDLVSDMAFQPRVGLDDDHVESMVRELNADLTTFEDKPIHAWRIGAKLFIVDGHHRFEAFNRKRECFATVPVVIHETQRAEGMSDEEHVRQSRSDALQHAIIANNHHGSPLKRSRKDNQRAVELALSDPIKRKLSDAAIAEMVGVSPATVGTIRKSKPEYQVDERVTKDGRVVSRERQASGADKRKKTEPQDTAAAEPQLPVDAGGPKPAANSKIVPISSSVTSVSVRGLDDEEPELTPEQVEERRRKFLDELFDVERLLCPDFEWYREFPRDKRDNLIPITDPFPSSLDEELDIEWIDDRKLCSAVLDMRVQNMEVHELVAKELVRRFLKLTNTTSSSVFAASPVVEPEPADNGKRKKIDWSTVEGIRESMKDCKFAKGIKHFNAWTNRNRIQDKRQRYANVPDDETLRSWWNSISA